MSRSSCLLLNELRLQTTQLHDALHDHNILSACTNGQLVLSDYVKLLKAFDVLWQSLLNSTEYIPKNLSKDYLIARANALKSDQEKICTQGSYKQEITGYKINSTDEFLGCYYVLVGSSLGAKTLFRHVKARFPKVPLTYLKYGPIESGWPDFIEYLEASHGEHTIAHVCNSAKKAFGAILNKLDEL